MVLVVLVALVVVAPLQYSLQCALEVLLFCTHGEGDAQLSFRSRRGCLGSRNLRCFAWEVSSVGVSLLFGGSPLLFNKLSLAHVVIDCKLSVTGRYHCTWSLTLSFAHVITKSKLGGNRHIVPKIVETSIANFVQLVVTFENRQRLRKSSKRQVVAIVITVTARK